MKKITTHSGLFGPFHTVETLDDRYRCNGELDLPFAVVGQGVIEDATPEDFPPPPRDPAEVQSEIVKNTQQRLDNFARTRNYDDILSLCTYATDLNPKFAAEGQYGVEARSATWAKLYAIMDEVKAGSRPMPATFADIEPELPALVWPN